MAAVTAPPALRSSVGGPGGGGPVLDALGHALLAQRILLRLPDASAAAAASRALRAVASDAAFELEWFLGRHEAAAPDRPWQYAAIAAWPAARVPGAAAPPRRRAAAAARLAAFLLAALKQRAARGALDASGPGSTPAEAEAAAARIGELLREHEAAAAAYDAAAAAAEAAASAAGDAGGGAAPEWRCDAAARALALACPHAEHLLLPYLAAGGHAGLMATVAPVLDESAAAATPAAATPSAAAAAAPGSAARAVLPWLAPGGPEAAPEHDVAFSAFLAAVRGGRGAAADFALRRLLGGDAAALEAAGGGGGGRSGAAAAAAAAEAAEDTETACLKAVVEHGAPALLGGGDCGGGDNDAPALRAAWRARSVAALREFLFPAMGALVSRPLIF